MRHKYTLLILIVSLVVISGCTTNEPKIATTTTQSRDATTSTIKPLIASNPSIEFNDLSNCTLINENDINSVYGEDVKKNDFHPSTSFLGCSRSWIGTKTGIVSLSEFRNPHGIGASRGYLELICKDQQSLNLGDYVSCAIDSGADMYSGTVQFMKGEFSIEVACRGEKCITDRNMMEKTIQLAKIAESRIRK